jgi:hypothetical protein
MALSASAALYYNNIVFGASVSTGIAQKVPVAVKKCDPLPYPSSAAAVLACFAAGSGVLESVGIAPRFAARCYEAVVPDLWDWSGRVAYFAAFCGKVLYIIGCWVCGLECFFCFGVLKSKSFKFFIQARPNQSQSLFKIFFRRSLRLHSVWRLKPPHKVKVKVKIIHL